MTIADYNKTNKELARWEKYCTTANLNPLTNIAIDTIYCIINDKDHPDWFLNPSLKNLHINLEQMTKESTSFSITPTGIDIFMGKEKPFHVKIVSMRKTMEQKRELDKLAEVIRMKTF